MSKAGGKTEKLELATDLDIAKMSNTDSLAEDSNQATDSKPVTMSDGNSQPSNSVHNTQAICDTVSTEDLEAIVSEKALLPDIGTMSKEHLVSFIPKPSGKTQPANISTENAAS